jgi:hypothetical protein
MRTPITLLFAALMAIPGWGAVPAHPGMLNYVEGQADIDGKAVTNKSVGSADVEQGQVLETGKGKAEILLTPGVFLRLGDNSALRMENNGLTNTSVALLRGAALVEATDLHKSNNIQIVDHGTTTTLEKNGLYSFRFDQPEVAVYDGKALVQEGETRQEIKKGKEIETADLKTVKFDTKQGDELYRWSDLRSEYLSDASVSSARTYLVEPGGWYGGGWYWNPGFGYYSYLPGDGYLWSPFGWGFFSPRVAYYAPRYGFGGGGAVNRGAVNRGFVNNQAVRGSGLSPAGRSGAGFAGGGGFHASGRR